MNQFKSASSYCQFKPYIFTISSQCLYTKCLLTTWVPHLGSSTRTRSNSNCRSSASLARRSIQKPEQHCHESSWLALPLALTIKYFNMGSKYFHNRVQIFFRNRFKYFPQPCIPVAHATPDPPVHVALAGDVVGPGEVDKRRLLWMVELSVINNPTNTHCHCWMLLLHCMVATLQKLNSWREQCWRLTLIV